MVCLCAASTAFGDGRRGGDDDTSPPDDSGSQGSSGSAETQENVRLFHSALFGVSVGELDMPTGLINDEDTIMVYQHNFGIYPTLSASGEITNGGLPQNVDLREHLREVERDIDRLIPEGFDGYVIIDYEEWHPFWEDTAGRYRLLAIDQVRQQKPNWDDAKIERKARKDFEKAAKKYIQKTLDKGRKLRPDAKWGIWSYPKVRFRDNDARWLWKRHDAFFPAIYMYGMTVPDGVEPGMGEIRESDFIEDRLVGRVAYSAELAEGEKEVMPVMRPWYSGNNDDISLRYENLNAHDLSLVMEMPFQYGADGIVIWDNVPNSSRAADFQDQLDYELAPEIRRILTSMGLPTDGEENAVDPGDDQEDVDGVGGGVEVVNGGEEVGRDG